MNIPIGCIYDAEEDCNQETGEKFEDIKKLEGSVKALEAFRPQKGIPMANMRDFDKL